MKKGRHRRFEEARALKRSTDFDPDRLFESLKGSDDGAGEDDGEFAEYDEDDDHDTDDRD